MEILSAVLELDGQRNINEAPPQKKIAIFIVNAAKTENHILFLKDEHELPLQFQKFSLKQTSRI
jgi:hypothetical protein